MPSGQAWSGSSSRVNVQSHLEISGNFCCPARQRHGDIERQVRDSID
jgi:hypothetical protein